MICYLKTLPKRIFLS